MPSFLIRLWENIVISLRAIKANKMRSILTTLGIIIGVLTVVSVASIIVGLNRSFENQISSIGSNNVYVTKRPWVIMDDWFKYRNRPNLTMKDAKFIQENMKLADAVAPSTSTRQAAKYRNNTLTRIAVNGVTMETERIDNFNIEEGRYFTSLEISNNKNSVIIGWDVKEKLFENQNPIGKRIRIGSAAYNVIGVMEKRGSILGHSLDTEVYVPIGSIFRNYGFHRSITIMVRVADPSMMEQAIDELGFLMRISRSLKPQEDDNFSINQQEVLTDVYNKLTGGLYTAAIGIGILSLVVGGIGIMNIMLVSVAERRKEIGLRKALGAKRSTITWQFIIESMIICSVGGVIALLLSFLTSFMIDKFTPFPASVPLWSIFIGMGFSISVGLFFGIYPARRAAKLDPIKALHYE